jgi:riboflavin biosynthesis pyrimidine reductase
MDVRADPDPGPVQVQPLRLKRLLPPGEPATVAEILEELGLWERPVAAPGWTRVMLNMISTADGRATVGGRSGPISDRADRALFHGLRSAVDAVLVGAGTVRAERYGRIIPDALRRQERQRRGLSEEPLACIVSERLALDADVPLLGEPSARVAILTASAASLPASPAHVDYIRAARDGALDLATALAELRERFAVHSLLCEGGPHLAGQLLAGGLVDELFLSLAPLLAGGDPPGEQALRILAGGELEPPVELKLLGALDSGSHLFLRYGVSAPACVSRETTLSSSLAS